MASSRAAQRYAKALLDLAEEKNTQDAINKEIRDIHSTLMNSQELRNVIKSPVVNPSSKVNALNAIFKDASVTIKNLFRVLATNNRISELAVVTKKFTELYDERNNIKVATVTTAETITPEMETKILSKVKSLTGSQVTLKSKIDKEILGGFILRIGDQQYDASVRGKLNALKTRFKNNAHV